MFGAIQKFHLCNSNILALARWAFKQIQEQHAQFSLSSTDFDKASPAYLTGIDYLKDPRYNKGLAFTLKERQMLGLQGLLAANCKTQEEQVEICSLSFERYKYPLNKYLYLCSLLESNERLFYSLINTDIEKYMPIVYTPTVGLACLKFGFVYNNCKGLFISIKDRGHIYNVLKNWHIQDVRAIVVTDGERILGLGDLGAYGMGIPIGKLCLYTALAGVKPHQCLPITLDTGTNNETLLVDPLYIGIRNKRVRGAEYDDFMDEFMEACVKRFGARILIQFEDFGLVNGPRLLDKYRDKYCTFNDDIQGTAAVSVAGCFAASRISKLKLSDNIFLFLGAGSAAAGIANLLVNAMVDDGLDIEEARSHIFLYDIDGLVSNKRSSGVPAHVKEFGKDMEPMKDFAKLVEVVKATCLIGVSTQGGAFTPAILKQMAKNTERPLIFALSNPTDKSECTAQEAYDNTEGRCIFASGSPFPPVKYNNKTYYTGQGNNSYIFPGVSLGIIAANINHVCDYMFLTAAKSLANAVSQKDLDLGRIYPSLKEIRSISSKIAEDIVRQAYKHDVAGIFPKPENICKFVESHIYDLKYPNYAPDVYEYCKEDDYTPQSVEEFCKTQSSPMIDVTDSYRSNTHNLMEYSNMRQRDTQHTGFSFSVVNYDCSNIATRDGRTPHNHGYEDIG